MARNKHPEITVNRILSTAFDLFSKKGYEQTTIQDIVNTLGDLSKGAIYHHFKSKDEIIDKLLDRVNLSFNPFLLELNEDLYKTGLEKLRYAFIQSLKDKNAIVLYHAAPYLLKNPKFLSKQFELTFSTSAPAIRKIIEEGILDGSITCDDPKSLSEVICLVKNIWINPSALPVDKSSFLARVSFAKKLFDGVGFPLIDDDVMVAIQEYADALDMPDD